MSRPATTPPVTRLLLSWSHEDKTAKDDLLERLAAQLRCLTGISTVWWQDSHIEIGTAWRQDIFARLDQCDFGVQLVSPAFLGSDFIIRHEIPPFVGAAPRKRALPVGLKPVRLDGSAEMHGIEDLQLFRLDHQHFYSELAGSRRDRFAADLAMQIRRRILDDGGWRKL